MQVGERKRGWGGTGGELERREESGRERAGVVMAWRVKTKPANHEAESAYVTGEGEAAENVMKFSEICTRASGLVVRRADHCTIEAHH